MLGMCGSQGFVHKVGAVARPYDPTAWEAVARRIKANCWVRVRLAQAGGTGQRRDLVSRAGGEDHPWTGSHESAYLLL